MSFQAKIKAMPKFLQDTHISKTILQKRTQIIVLLSKITTPIFSIK
jgi:hypothetical protein